MPGLQSILEEIPEAAERDLERRAEAEGVTVEVMRAREKAEREALQQEQEAKDRLRRQESEKVLKARDAKRLEFGKSLGLNTPCHIGHVIKLSGLSARSAGNGWDRATVWHVVVDGNLNTGRLSRSAGDLLCRKAPSFGARTMGISGRGDWAHECDPDPEAAEITCRTCLNRIKSLAAVKTPEQSEKSSHDA